jgi:hypothetical protein
VFWRCEVHICHPQPACTFLGFQRHLHHIHILGFSQNNYPLSSPSTTSSVPWRPSPTQNDERAAALPNSMELAREYGKLDNYIMPPPFAASSVYPSAAGQNGASAGRGGMYSNSSLTRGVNNPSDLLIWTPQIISHVPGRLGRRMTTVYHCGRMQM